MKSREIFNVLIKNINECEHRHLVKKEDGTYREETDDEFRKRLIEKYRKSEEEMSEEILKNITIKQFQKKDLCLEDFSEERLYDYCTLEEFYEDIINTLSQETDIVEFDNACKSFIEQAKKIKVFKKLPIRINYGCIKNYIEEWYYDNASSIDYDYEVELSERAEILLEKLTKEIHKKNQVYRQGVFIGYIDLSNEVKEYIEDYSKD